MDQGVIRILKAKYRTVLVQKYIRANDQQKSLPKTSILDAMDILAHRGLWYLKLKSLTALPKLAFLPKINIKQHQMKMTLLKTWWKN